VAVPAIAAQGPAASLNGPRFANTVEIDGCKGYKSRIERRSHPAAAQWNRHRVLRAHR
jgi:hypothetical protein